MRADLKKLLRYADEHRFAVPAFNYSDVWEMEAIVEAAEEENAPVMIATNAQVAKAHKIPYLGAQGLAVADISTVPVINHLDHCTEIELCKCAIDSGYPSVMIDYSHKTLEENIAAAKEVVAYAASKNVAVEAEIGRIKGINEEGAYMGDDFLVDVASATQLAQQSGVDSLAIGIGNAHGFYAEKPNIRFDRLQEVNQAIDTPLVLHGGTGIPEEDIKKAIKLGINKVNIGTQIHHCYLMALDEELKRNDNRINIVDIMLPVKEAMKQEVRKHIKICMADGKAAQLSNVI